MTSVDLSRLLGGKRFTISCTVVQNGFSIRITALADSGANAFALLDTTCAQQISQFLGAAFEPVGRSIPVKGYNGQFGKPITTMLRLNLRVNGQRQYDDVPV